MRRNLLALLLCTQFAFACCDGGLFGFKVTDDIDESTIEGSLLGTLTGELFEVSIPLSLDIEAETASRGTGPANGVFLTALRLDVTSTTMPAGDTDNFETVEVRVEASDGSLCSQVIATLSGQGFSLTTVRFTVDKTVNLLPYAEAGVAVEEQRRGLCAVR
ncbi:MAG: hypothetical protein ACJAYU_000570 [Bradymonadia bacterium]|jgi:hypothetical protein